MAENYHKECLFGCWMDTMILLVCLGKSICQGQTFVVLLVLLIVTAFADGGSIFFFYTQWTFTLVTIYFGLGSLLSMYGCYQYHKRVGGNRIDNDGLDEEQGTPTHEISSTMPNVAKISGPREGSHHAQKTAGMWSYVFQIIFQVCSSISELCRSRSSSSISMISECKARADIPNPEELFARLVVLLHDPLARGQLATQILKNRAYIQRRS